MEERTEMAEAERIARLGQALYEREIRASVESDHDGEFLVVDVGTGEYALARDEDEAFEEVEAKNPDGEFYLLRVGSPAAHSMRSGASAPA